VQFEPRDDLFASSLVWTMQVSAVVIGHVVGAWLGHAAVRRSRREGQDASQWPLAALMIAMTVLALWSLGQNLVFVAEVVPSLPPSA
jgi:ABC-type amino acid transport system permease subunit